MARRRLPEQHEESSVEVVVSAELTDHQALCWLDQDRFARWCVVNLGRELRFDVLADHCSVARFTRAAEEWALQNGVVSGEYQLTSWVRLAEFGVRRVRRLRALGPR